MLLKLLQKTVEALGNLKDNKIADKVTKVSKSSPQNNLGIVESETRNREILKERYRSPEKQQIIDDLRIIY